MEIVILKELNYLTEEFAQHLEGVVASDVDDRAVSGVDLAIIAGGQQFR